MKKFGKKALSLVAASAMMFTLLPTPVAAAKLNPKDVISNVVGFVLGGGNSQSGSDSKNDNNANTVSGNTDNGAQTPAVQAADVDEAATGIVFKFYETSDSSVSVGLQNGVKFTVDLIDEKGNNVALTKAQIESIPKTISFKDNYVEMNAENFKDIDLEGYTFSKGMAYFYWEGDFKGTKYAAYSFTNFARDPGYATSNYIGYTSEYNSVGDGTFGNDSTGTGTFWYQENGTLHLVFYKVLPNAPKTVYHVNDSANTLFTENDNVDWRNRQYVYYPADKTSVYNEAYMEENFDDADDFMGWFEDAACTKPVSADFFNKNVTADVHVYAKWEMQQHSVEYSWEDLPSETLYDADGNVVVPQLPEDITGLTRDDKYVVDTTYTSQTVLYTHDEFGNKNNEVTFSGWTDPSNGEMGREDVAVTGTWTTEEIEVPTWNVTYSWNMTPDGAVLPVDTKDYINNEEVIVDTTYVVGSTIDTYDEFGNVNGAYVFSGWSSVGKIKKDETIEGTWTFNIKDVKNHKVTYTWSGDVPSTETLPSEASYVKNQPYTVDSKYVKGYTVNETSLFGNLKGQYVFGGWNLSGEQLMGEKDVVISGVWTYNEDPEYKLYNVTYNWTGLPEETLYDADGNVVVPELPASQTGLEKGQTYKADTEMPGTVVYTHAENGNVNASYTLGSWSQEEGTIGRKDVEITAEWSMKPATYTITIHFVDEETGEPIADDYTETFEVGSDFEFTVPAVPGYDPEYDIVRDPEGNMPAENVEITIKYTKEEPVTPSEEESSEDTSKKEDETTKAEESSKAQETTKANETTKAQETTKANETTKAQETTKANEITKANETTKASEDEETAAESSAADESEAASEAEIAEENETPSEDAGEAEEEENVGTFVKNDDGSFDMTDLTEEEAPAGLLHLGHKDCILHFLFVFAAMMVLFFYGDSRRKNQEKILELRNTLSEAEKRFHKGGKQ